jgi:phosphonate transport system substrate-binding protein
MQKFTWPVRRAWITTFFGLSFIGCIGLIGLQGCQQGSDSAEMATHNPDANHSSLEAATTPQKSLVLAVHPFDVPTKVQQHFLPIVTYLSQALEQPVELYVATSYEDQVRQIATGKVDLAYLGPSSFVTAYDKFTDEQGRKIQSIATERPYQAAVVVHADSPIQSMGDLVGKSMAFGSYFSYAGHFSVRQAMRDQQVSLADLQLYSFMGRHERAVLSVVYGSFDAAATTFGIAERMRKLNYPLKVIYVSDDLAPIVFAAAPGLSSQQVAKLKQSMLEPGFEAQEQLSLFAPGGRYYPFKAADYQSVRAALQNFEQ